MEDNFRLKAGTEDGAWEFVRYHLGKLPVINESNGTAVVNSERQGYLLFDRMVAFHIQRGVMVPISSPEFYAGLEQRFSRRDGMYFLPDQVAEYDRALLDSDKPVQLSLFVTDEKTAITWLRQQLDPATGGEPQTRGDLTNPFNQTMHRAKHEQALELIEILQAEFPTGSKMANGMSQITIKPVTWRKFDSDHCYKNSKIIQPVQVDSSSFEPRQCVLVLLIASSARIMSRSSRLLSDCQKMSFGRTRIC